jgi:hypothetical protein
LRVQKGNAISALSDEDRNRIGPTTYNRGCREHPPKRRKIMCRHLLANMIRGAVMCGVLLVAPMPAASAKLSAITHVALIPEGSDLRTVRFEKVKTVKVRATQADTESCEELAAREHRSASADCPQAEALTAAYEVTYSYTGQPMASDEYGNRHYTFQVYFWPDELPAVARKALATGKPKRADIAPYFAVRAGLEPQKTGARDESRPVAPSGYVVVKVELSSALGASRPVSADVKPSEK